MRIWQLLSLSTFAKAVFADIGFEPADFNVTAALIDNGVNVSAIPELARLAESSSPDACSIACKSLEETFGTSNVLTQEEPDYKSFTGLYWSKQQSLVAPTCIFKPEKSLDVSTVVLLSRLTRCPFAVKSGGHAAFAGSSSISGGITVAMERMKEISLSSDHTTASIQPGNRWYHVYGQLEKQNLTVIGGRVAPIGVGGLTLGGGISFFTNEYGWACDNIASYELVTATGAIIQVSATTFPDLFWALRGGGNNFGIVTKFNLKTIPQGKMWGGPRQYLEPEFPALLEAFYNLGINSEQDTKVAQILSFAYASIKIAVTELEYSEPVANAPVLAEYMAIPSIQDDTGIRTLSELTVGLDSSSVNGSRQTFWTTTFKLDKAFLKDVTDIFYEEIMAIADAKQSIPAGSLQVITRKQLAKMSQQGGNPLGLDISDGPLVLFLCGISWTNETDDERVMRACSNIINRTQQEARAKGLGNDYLYMPYASPYQKVIDSYGAENQQKLTWVAEKYDPTGVFQVLQPGYFKLYGAPFGDFA